MTVSATATTPVRFTPPTIKGEAGEGPGPDRVKDHDSDDAVASAAAVKAAAPTQPVSAAPRSPLAEAAGKLLDKLV